MPGLKFNKPRKYVKRAVKTVKKVLSDNYGGKGGMQTLMRDVANMKMLINVEKKHLHSNVTDQMQFAQSNTLAYTNYGGVYVANVTPQISQGVTASTRTGNSVKATGCCFEFEVVGDSALVNSLAYKIHIVRKRDNQSFMTPSTALSLIWIPNPFSPNGAAIDTFSTRDVDNMKNFQIVKTISGRLEPDSLTGQTARRQHRVPLKLNHHFRYDGPSTTLPIDNNYFIYVVADSGVQSLNTGGLFRYNVRWFFTDN